MKNPIRSRFVKCAQNILFFKYLLFILNLSAPFNNVFDFTSISSSFSLRKSNLEIFDLKISTFSLASNCKSVILKYEFKVEPSTYLLL